MASRICPGESLRRILRSTVHRRRSSARCAQKGRTYACKVLMPPQKTLSYHRRARTNIRGSHTNRHSQRDTNSSARGHGRTNKVFYATPAFGIHRLHKERVQGDEA